MKITFYKYHGTGNDFIIIDNREMLFDRKRTDLIKKLCDRRFGIGADGLMLLQNKPGYDFEMVYYNSDGNESSMCGNGGRCIVAFAKSLGLVTEKARFVATDGEHEAVAKDNWISLKMNDVPVIEKSDDFYFLNTGSPHYVKFVKNIKDFPVFEEGKKIRYNNRFKEGGTNVNFVEIQDGALFVRTYERGVENETYSCGTGVTAAAIVAAIETISTQGNSCDIKTLGGNLRVRFNNHSNKQFNDIWLEGPAAFVFKGEVEI